MYEIYSFNNFTSAVLLARLSDSAWLLIHPDDPDYKATQGTGMPSHHCHYLGPGGALDSQLTIILVLNIAN